jgi:mannose-6-phosphate isomerase-like protein (cupin superfamily)
MKNRRKKQMEPCTKRSASLDQEQEALWYLGGLRIIQALTEQSREDRKIFEYLEPTGTCTFSYAPYREDTAFYVIEGEAIFSSGKTIAHATPGTFLFLPRNVSFRYEVTRSGPARILTWTTPMGFAHQVMNMGEPGQAFVLPPPSLLEREKIQQFALLLLPSLDARDACIIREDHASESEQL